MPIFVGTPNHKDWGEYGPLDDKSLEYVHSYIVKNCNKSG